jgi:hypothetical protein
MFKKKLSYTNYNGEKVTKEYYFNLSRAEILRMQFTTVGGFQAYVQQIVDAQDIAELYKLFEKLVQESYGVKTPDGEEFDKFEADRVTPRWKRFSQTEAYSELMMELVNDTDAAVAFIKGIIPSAPTTETETNTSIEVAK